MNLTCADSGVWVVFILYSYVTCVTVSLACLKPPSTWVRGEEGRREEGRERGEEEREVLFEGMGFIFWGVCYYSYTFYSIYIVFSNDNAQYISFGNMTSNSSPLFSAHLPSFQNPYPLLTLYVAPPLFHPPIPFDRRICQFFIAWLLFSPELVLFLCFVFVSLACWFCFLLVFREGPWLWLFSVFLEPQSLHLDSS